ncbi:hypothetical protein GSI_13884 [Ganoderma sinense ZZ0214-1]|uniref:Uncharacterized protein n=1 Tax=Ganoderma sinense ZZ0214-1 TaxID=1077348 RepID=A0A2G8RRK8_9APHY|nr:hypothetical protein GSI_13884 [Ganoderma sinense ZZ0214-1]
MQLFPDALAPTRIDRRLTTGRLTLASAWSNLIAEKPRLPFYFYVVENGWKEEPLVCARRLVQGHNTRDLATLYDPKMETVGSLPLYRRLLAYAQACRAAASADFRLHGLPSSDTALSYMVRLAHTPPRDTVHRVTAGVA